MLVVTGKSISVAGLESPVWPPGNVPGQLELAAEEPGRLREGLKQPSGQQGPAESGEVKSPLFDSILQQYGVTSDAATQKPRIGGYTMQK